MLARAANRAGCLEWPNHVCSSSLGTCLHGDDWSLPHVAGTLLYCLLFFISITLESDARWSSSVAAVRVWKGSIFLQRTVLWYSLKLLHSVHVSTIAKLSDREEMPQQTWFKHFIQQHCVKPYSIVIQHTDFYLSCYCEFYATATQILFSTVSCKSARCGVICWVAPESGR